MNVNKNILKKKVLQGIKVITEFFWKYLYIQFFLILEVTELSTLETGGAEKSWYKATLKYFNLYLNIYLIYI